MPAVVAKTPAAITDMGALAIVVSRDTLAPSTPGSLTATPVSISQINLSWGSSIDTGGSGLKGYNLYRNGSLLIGQIPSLSFSDTGLSFGPTFTYQVSAIDNAGNESTLSAPVATTTLNLPPSWSGTPAPAFTNGTSASYSFAALVSDPEGDPITFTMGSGALPTGVVLNSAGKSLDYNGAGAAATASGLALRATATGGATNSSVFSLTIAALPTGPVWQVTISLNLTVGVPFSLNLDTVCTGAQSYTLVSPIPAGLSMSGGLRNNTIAGTPTTTGTVSVSFDASDVAGYSTNFDLTEAKISEGGVWVSNGGQQWTDISTTPGFAFGTNGANNTLDDSNAHLLGFPATQTIIGVIKRGNIPAGETHEVELHLRATTSAGSTTLYEADLDYNGNFVFARWNGALNDFIILPNTGGAGNWGGVPQNGEIFSAQISGNVMKAWKGLPGTGTLVGQSTDSTFSSGNPGFGTFKRIAGINTLFGFSSITATSP